MVDTLERAAVGEVENALRRYAGPVRRALSRLPRADNGDPARFTPPAELPDDGTLDEFFAPSTMSFHRLGDYDGRRLTLLNLMGNARTRTTKTYPSLVIVARAVQHIRQTGEAVMIVTPSSANKATALRDAVLRAIELDLVAADRLSILSVVPDAAHPKLWSSALDADPQLALRNPVATYNGPEPGEVKLLARRLVDEHAAGIWATHRTRLWHTMDIENYKAADVVRAYAEHEFFPLEPGRTRLHVHAVSSAFGLLGHNLGLEELERDGAVNARDFRYLMVQHLGTPDMVLSLLFGASNRELLPSYRYEPTRGVYVQDGAPNFPHTTFAVDETLDSTFYTRRPVTSDQMNTLIRQRGGGGIVVSLHECLARYGALRAMLDPTGVRLPADPRDLREWSLVMALTGTLNAIDRGLVAEDDIIVHGTGSYGPADYQRIPDDRLRPVANVDELAAIAEAAVGEGTR
ncbi:DUF6002 family protein [Micromonospora sp. NPDC051196]|uniref:DUF6002 family protein n=1 Tax=Micromonospora sp. NPDC051196 TaxID=3155281 RepID=UPI0034356233